MSRKNVLKLVGGILFSLTVLLSGCGDKMMKESDNKMPVSEERMMDDPMEPMAGEPMKDRESGMNDGTMNKSKADKME